jgi:hypothetical protein
MMNMNSRNQPNVHVASPSRIAPGFSPVSVPCLDMLNRRDVKAAANAINRAATIATEDRTQMTTKEGHRLKAT